MSAVYQIMQDATSSDSVNTEDLPLKRRKIIQTLQVLHQNLLIADAASSSVFKDDDLSREYLIELFMRCKYLYTVYGEVKKILILILRQEDIFNE